MRIRRIASNQSRLHAWVTRAKKKSMMQEKARRRREIARRMQCTRLNAQQMIQDNLNRAAVFVEETAAREDIPFRVDTTHRDLVYLGGYVGCRMYMSVAACMAYTPLRTNKIIGSCKRAAGFAREERKGASGAWNWAGILLEIGNGHKDWPDGGNDPLPRTALCTE